MLVAVRRLIGRRELWLLLALGPSLAFQTDCRFEAVHETLGAGVLPGSVGNEPAKIDVSALVEVYQEPLWDDTAEVCLIGHGADSGANEATICATAVVPERFHDLRYGLCSGCEGLGMNPPLLTGAFGLTQAALETLGAVDGSITVADGTIRLTVAMTSETLVFEWKRVEESVRAGSNASPVCALVRASRHARYSRTARRLVPLGG